MHWKGNDIWTEFQIMKEKGNRKVSEEKKIKTKKIYGPA